MPHVALVAMSGVRIVDDDLLSLGLTLPGFRARSQAVAELPALGLLTLGALTDDAWSQSYHTATAVTEELLHEILSHRPTLVAISALTASVNTAYELSRRLTAENVPVALGGLHASTCPEEAEQYVDAVCVGDGEALWPQLLKDARRGQLRPRYLSDPWTFPPSSIIPRWDLLGARRLPRYTLQTQRGCPLACSFCAASRLLGPHREKNVASIDQELAAVCRHAGTHRPLIELADDNTFAGSRPLDEFWQVFSDSGVRFFTESDWRIGERPEVYQNLHRAGCRQILIGVESLVFRYLGMGDKLAELGRIIESVHRLQDHGVAVNGCFIVGSDGETRASIDRLGDFLESSPFADVQVTLQTPFPGTSLYRQLSRTGRLLSQPGDWSAYTLFDVAYRPDSMTPQELCQGFRQLIERVYGAAATDRRRRIRTEIDRKGRSLPGRDHKAS